MKRDELLKLLRQAYPQYLSGQHVSETLGISRAGVWKHIEELRKQGYEIEAVPRKGYQLISSPNSLSHEEIHARLETAWLGSELIYEPEVSSTQDIAHTKAQAGAKEGLAVVSDRQIKGKGRLGRPFYSEPEHGIYTSVILRPDVMPYQAPQLTLVTAVAMCEAFQDVTGVTPEIKWPNDILFSGRKTCGILTEMQSEPDRIQAVIIGVGMNINQQPQDFSEELQNIATSLRAETGETYNRAEVLAAVYSRLEHWYVTYIHEGFAPIKAAWEHYAVSIGRELTARSATSTITGKAEGITEEGMLLLRDETGTIHKIYSADVEITRSDS